MSDEPWIHITPGPTVELKREPDERETRWCFGCRKHLPHEWVLMGDEGLSYYDPSWHLECSQCHHDLTSLGARKW